MFNETKATDKDYILKAIEKSGQALQFASPELRSDKDFVLKVVDTKLAMGASRK